MDLELLKGLLNDPYINISEISDAIGISKTTIYNIIKGKYIPTQKTFDKLAKYFSEKNILKDNEKINTLAKQLQEELSSNEKDITLVISQRIIGKLENFKIL